MIDPQLGNEQLMGKTVSSGALDQENAFKLGHD